MSRRYSAAIPLSLLLLVAMFHVFITHALATLDDAKQISIVEYKLDGKLKNLVWLGENGKTAMARTDSSLYLTTDAGRTWNSQNGMLCKEDKCVSKIIVNPVDPKMVLLIGTGNTAWVARNINNAKYDEVKFTLEGKPLVIDRFHFHPKEVQRGLALVKMMKESQTYTLFETRDLGVTWKKIAENIRSVGWGNPSMRPFDPNMAFAIQVERGRLSFVSVNVNTLKVKEIVANGRAFSFSKSYLFVATSSSSEEASLFISHDNAHTMKKTTLSVKDTRQAKFTILDSEDGSIFINVFHSEFGSEPWGTVYHSDSTGTRFSESLPFNYRSGASCDFHRIKSMEGVFISNTISNHDDDSCRNCPDYGRCVTLCNFASRISYDRGSTWEPIRGPKVDSQKEIVTCKKDARIDGTDLCQLNLQGLAARAHMPIHSHEDTPGVILAAGNIGADLNGPMSPNTNVYLSRDAGVTWEEIAKGPHLYDIIDQGSQMVLVSNKQTHEFSYSWDQGMTWTKSNLTKSGDKLDMVKIHQSHAHDAKTIMIEGSRSDDSVMISVDLSNVLPKTCTGISKPDEKESNYEYFKRRSQTTSKCFLGKKVDYVRRKRDAQCSNSGQRGKNKIEKCACSYSDYECDFGFEASKGEGGEFICNPMKGFVPRTGPPRGCFTFYNVTRGYLKIAGDSCYGGIDLNPIQKACPNGLGVVGVMIVLLFSCAVCGFVSYFLHKSSASVRNRVVEQYSQLDMNEEFNFDDDEDGDAPEIDETLFRGKSNRREFNDENVRRKLRAEDNGNQNALDSAERLESGTGTLPSAPEVDDSIFEDDDVVLQSIDVQGGGSLNNDPPERSSGFNPRASRSEV